MVKSVAVAEVLDDWIGKGHLGGCVHLHSINHGVTKYGKGGCSCPLKEERFLNLQDNLPQDKTPKKNIMSFQV